MRKIVIINGPNLNLLGKRKTEVYGTQSFEDYLEMLRSSYNLEIEYFQSNVEGEIVNALHHFSGDGIILNAGAYTHTSIAIRDAVEAIDSPVVEVHISNITQRESFRHDSFISPVAVGCIYGFGLKSYELALNFFLKED